MARTRIALAGNPNSGKTTVFNKLTGSSQRVGNWPGVTIDRKEGRLKGADGVDIVDLPGIYSLSPYSPEEIVSRDFLLKDRPEAVIDIVDASNLERNLYLTTQIVEAGLPTVIALNMIDVARKNNVEIDSEVLSSAFGCKVVETAATKREGLDELSREAVEASKGRRECVIRYSEGLERHASEVASLIEGSVPAESARWYALKILERDEMALASVPEESREAVEKAISDMEGEFGDEADSIVAGERYAFIERTVAAAVKRDGRVGRETPSDRVDKIVTNRWLGLPIFALVMFFTYYISISTIGTMGTDWVNDEFFGNILIPGTEEWLADNAVNEVLSALIVDGIISGVGAVLGFLPQILVLFVMLSILEDCGYMARVAFVMDRLFRRFGLSGKSFIPILIGTGCGVPGILSAKTIEGERERRITAMTTTFIPCSAKLPLIALISGAIFFESPWIAVSTYFMGIFCILLSGLILKKWRTLSGPSAPFMMELPAYHVPSLTGVIRSTLERGWAFVKKAGTFILLACVAIWFLSAFDWGFHMVEEVEESMLADIGNALKWIFAPLGWGDEWEFTVSSFTGILAKENIVGTMGILFGFSEDDLEGSASFWGAVAARFGEGTVGSLAAYSFMAFNLICVPCLAAVGAMRRELGSWRDTAKAAAYQCVLAYIVAMLIYQFGCAIAGEPSPWIVAAAGVLIALVYILAAKDPFAPLARAMDRVRGRGE
ncbi:MAG: ferrous iron transport protein B [Candidatus Methanoplasma sp.]|jgi:ferrous iron transport protein B|nr:ferrous iron transport protein B [Candidatus Methanoplasma sp.]